MLRFDRFSGVEHSLELQSQHCPTKYINIDPALLNLQQKASNYDALSKSSFLFTTGAKPTESNTDGTYHTMKDTNLGQ